MTDRHASWFKFYPADFMNGVRGLSAQEVGLYTMILCRIYEESGPVEYHPLRLSTYCGMREATFTKTFEKLVALGKLRVVDGSIVNARAETEISNRSHDLESASRAGKASAKKRQQNQRHEATGVQRAFNHTDTDTDTDIGGGRVESAGARQTSAPEAHDALPPTDRELVLEAMGFGPDGVVSPGRMIGGQGDMAELRRWLDLPGMTLPIIIDEIRRIAGSKPDGPVASFKYFTPAMTRLSGQLTAPRLIPTPYAHQPQQDGPHERFNRPRQAAADRRQDRPDPALEQIARLAGLGRAPGDVGG